MTHRTGIPVSEKTQNESKKCWQEIEESINEIYKNVTKKHNNV